MRVGFVTCVELGRACIEEILALGGADRPGEGLVALFSLHDQLARAKSGRIYLDQLADRHSLPLTTFRHVNDPDAVAALAAADLDWLLIIGWSQIASDEVLAVPRRGVLGMHPTLLPRGRGRASIPWAIIKGLPQTGVTLFKLDPGVDTGEIAAQQVVPIEAAETADTLYAKVAAAHRQLIRDAWPRLLDGTLPLTVQDESQASEWPGRTPADGRIDPTMTVAEIDRLVRATTRPYPGAFVDGDRGAVTVWRGSLTRPQHTALAIPAVDGVYWGLDTEPRR